MIPLGEQGVLWDSQEGMAPAGFPEHATFLIV